MYLTVLLLSVIIIFISFILLGFNIFFRKKNFPETSVGHNRHMKKLGITCVKHDEIKLYRKLKNQTKINPLELKIAPE